MEAYLLPYDVELLEIGAMTLPRLRYIYVSIPVALAVGLACVRIFNAYAPPTVTVAPGTRVMVRLNHSLVGTQHSPGDQFAATLTEPVWADGKIVIPKGAVIIGKVVAVRVSGSPQGAARLRLTLSRIEMNGKDYELHTTDVAQYGNGAIEPDWKLVGPRAGGHLPGALGGGGAMIETPAGGGAGTVATAIAGGKKAGMLFQTPLQFKLIEPLVVPLKG